VQKQLQNNLQAVRARIAAAAQQAGRPPADVQLVAVTKSVSSALAGALVDAGQLDLGENRVDELERKVHRLAEREPRPRWHMIGHLQGNKVRRVVRLADAIHSIDSERLLGSVDRIADEEGRRPELYLQVKLADEASKSGLAPGAVARLVEHATLRAARLVGLMTIAPQPLPDETLDDQLVAASKVFEALAVLANELPERAFGGQRPRLSMGMSTDFEVAVGAGSHVVRVGSALFEGVDLLDAGEPRE